MSTQSSPIVTIFPLPLGLAVHTINVKLLSCHFNSEEKETNMCLDPALMNKHKITESVRDTLSLYYL